MPVRPRVLLLATHPIQYQVPLFQAISRRPEVDFSVLYVRRPTASRQGVGFGVAFQWDIPLLEGYAWREAPRVHGAAGGSDGFFASRIAAPLALLKEISPDVLVLTGWHAWPMLQMLMAARMQGVPVIMRGESNAFRRRPLPVRLLHRALLGLCQAFLTIGKSNRAFYLGNGVAVEAMFDTSYFVDNERFARSAAQLAPERARLRSNWAIPQEAACFCFAGKLEPKKRILDLLRAFHLASERSARPLHLLVVGSGELMDPAKAYAEQHQLPVTFAGFLNQTEIPAAYAAADCLVLPSDFGETWGLVVNEAMACGLPAIVSDRVGCGPDLVVPARTGAVFPFGDIPALADALVQMAADPRALKDMGAAARRHLTGHYCVDNAVNGTLAAVRAVLARA